ncbi:penicillin-binding protein [Paucisalibacillus globulus]|uniref:penicillin-binding protein n=1 Tax=Paucisalibacillus globulus TaxID=351095 RepID=UPI000BB80BA3|nr:penicillin-binding protein [Paucisalibacillus globulus]
MNNQQIQGYYNGYNQTDERIFPIVPFLTGLVAGPLLYNAFNPYYGYPAPYPYPVPVPYDYGYNYGYGNPYNQGYGKGYY